MNTTSSSDAPEDRHAGIVARVLAWAERDDNIRALILTGSTTRAAGSTDRFSDRDIEVIARNPVPLLENDRWIHAIAPVWASLYLENGADDPDTRLVFFEGGRKVDFCISGPARLSRMVETGHLDGLYERGYRVLMDKDGLAARLPAPSGTAPRTTLPTAREFTDTVTEFWFEAAHMPGYLTRQELWVVKFRDWTMKTMLLRMLEWHTVASSGPDTDVWYIGTKMKRWLDDATWTEVQDVFGHFDQQDSFRALTASMRLFTRLSHEVAAKLGYDVPDTGGHIEPWVLGFAGELGGTPAG